MAPNGGTGVDVPPAVPSGVARRRAEIVGGLVFLTAVYRIVVARWSTVLAAPRYCPSDEPCPRPDLLAFQVCSGIMQVYMGLAGFVAWHVTKRAHKAVPPTPEGRLFGYVEEADRLNAAIFVYQTFDFFASLSIPEHRTAVFLFHHAASALTAWFSLEHQFVHHYAIFFGGCSEFSTIFLVLCDYDVFFPAEHGSAWGLVIFVCQACFTVFFFYYRIVAWMSVSVALWRDGLYALREGVAEKFRPGRGWFLKYFLAIDVVLGSLQVYWFGFGIVPKIVEIMEAEAER